MKHTTPVRLAMTLIAIALTLPAGASTILTIAPLLVVVPQSESDPCIICGTTQAHNPPTFGYNNFDTTGNTGALTLFSTNLFESLGDNIEETLGNNYSAGEIEGVFGNRFTFGVAIDVNSAEGGNPPTIMQLQKFMLIDLTTQTILAGTPAPVDLPDIHPGNGKGDYLISGFDLSGISASDRIVFRAQFTGATDGPDSFYLTATPNVANSPESATWVLMTAGLLVAGITKRRAKTKA